MARDPDCIFCKIVAGEIPCIKLFEDDAVLSFMDINPFNGGHCLVIPKNHARDLYAMSDAELAACAAVSKRVAGAVNQALAPAGINLIQANGAGAGQTVFHFHFHIFPRDEGDDAKLNWGHKPGDMGRVEANAKKIVAALED